MNAASSQRKPHVLIAGGGVAGLEALIALRDLAGDRVEITLVAPEEEFTYKPLTVEEPFSLEPAERRALEPIAEEFDARFVKRAIVSARPDAHSVELSDGSEIGYDILVVCVGGRPRAAYREAITFQALQAQGDSLRIDEVLSAAAKGDGRIGFVVPPGVSWQLPIYELALMTQRRAREAGQDEVRCLIVTPESKPLIMFGPAASAAVAALLKARGIEVRTGAHARETESGELELIPEHDRLDADAIVALPAIEGPGIPGLPADERGFIPIGRHCHVPGAEDVYAAGDGTTFPIKQGGLATQQADAAAEHIAARFGADLKPRPFRPVLRGKLLCGDESLNLRQEPTGGAGEGIASLDYLWWPPHKISGRYLAAWLARETPHADPKPPVRPLDVEVELSEEWHREPMALDPHEPLSD